MEGTLFMEWGVFKVREAQLFIEWGGKGSSSIYEMGGEVREGPLFMEWG